MTLSADDYACPPATARHKWAGILAEIGEIYHNNYSESSIERIEKVFYDMIDLFMGRMEGYYKCDTKYHDLEHSLETTRLTAKIINKWNKKGEPPIISERFFELAIIAALLHDTGYIRKYGDIEGTGAKYTFIHEERSIEFAKKYMASIQYSKEAITSVENMIICTILNADLSKIKFSCEEERIAGFSLGTADLAGQMATSDYIKRLHHLFEEFKEGYQFEDIDNLKKKGIIIFESLDGLIRNIPDFYKSVAENHFEEMGSMYKFLEHDLLMSIEENVKFIKYHYDK
jgi:hypothetical protein